MFVRLAAQYIMCGPRGNMIKGLLSGSYLPYQYLLNLMRLGGEVWGMIVKFILI